MNFFISFHFCYAECSLLCEFMLQLSNSKGDGFIAGMSVLLHFVGHEVKEFGLETTIWA